MYYEFTNPITDKVNIMTQQTHTNRGTAVVTGASTGMGALYAGRLARMGYDLIIVARNHNRLNQLAEHITTDSGRSVEVITTDLADAAQLNALKISCVRTQALRCW